MGQTKARDGEALEIGAAFADPAFTGAKARAAPFAILRAAVGDRAGEVMWANAAAARFWGADTAAGLAEALFGADGRSGWLAGLTRGLTPDLPPRPVRAGRARGFHMRVHTALIRAWTDRDGAMLIGLAVPDFAPRGAAASAGDGGAWRRPAWAPVDEPTAPSPVAASSDAQPVSAPHRESSAAPSAEGTRGPAADASDVDEGRRDGGDGSALARRGHLAVLRDRLSRALDGAAALRMVWRTDAAGAVTAIDARALARLGSPLRFDGSETGSGNRGALPDAVAPFDPAGAERLRAALGTPSTFAGLAFDLPVADAAATVPMALSGSPVFGPERAFEGFRGFGTVDLGRLALAERRAPLAKPVAEPRAEAEAGHAPAAPEIAVETAPEPAAEVTPPAGTEPEPVPAAEPAPWAAREPSAKVVQLRAFQGAASGRFGAVPAPPPGEAGTGQAEPEAREDADSANSAPASTAAPAGHDTAASDRQGAGDALPLDDQLAFLALGEALRARIGAAGAELPVAAESAETEAVPAPAAPLAPEASEAPGEPASALLDRLPIPVIATVDGRVAFANPAAAARLGYADARALIAAGADAALPAAEAGHLALRAASGEVATVAARRAEVPWGGGSGTLWLLAEPEGDRASPGSRGIGGRADAPARPAPEALAPDAVEDRSVELLDRVDDAVALLDAAGRLRRLNRRGEAWFGRRDPEAVPSLGLAELLVPESRAAALALLGEVRNQRDGLGAPPLRRDVVARTAENAAVPMLLTVGRLGGSNGASGFYATLRDVSALQRAEIDRDRTERDRARAAGRLPDLLAKVSHEIRTPLSAILGFAEVMMDERFGPLGNPRYKDYLKDIHASGAQVVALVEDLLDLSRIEAGQLDLDLAPVDINRVVTEAVAQMQPEAHRERVIMRTSLAGRIPSVLADERSARQIVKNLLSNAVKFNEPGGQVIVSTAPGEGEGILLRVRDTGVGMSEEAIAAALEPFGGLPARATGGSDGASHGLRLGSGGTGNGLGLPLTRALVGANGASMTIRSRPREGTLVEVSFAAAEEGSARRPA